MKKGDDEGAPNKSGKVFTCEHARRRPEAKNGLKQTNKKKLASSTKRGGRTVRVRVSGGGDPQAKKFLAWVFSYLNAVAHDGHLVKRRLPVEDDDVIVPQVSLHGVAVLQGEAVLVADEPQVHPDAIMSHDVSVDAGRCQAMQCHVSSP